MCTRCREVATMVEKSAAHRPRETCDGRWKKNDFGGFYELAAPHRHRSHLVNRTHPERWVTAQAIKDTNNVKSRHLNANYSIRIKQNRHTAHEIAGHCFGAGVRRRHVFFFSFFFSFFVFFDEFNESSMSHLCGEQQKQQKRVSLYFHSFSPSRLLLLCFVYVFYLNCDKTIDRVTFFP